MNDSNNYIIQLEDTLQKKREYLETNILPKLKEHLNIFQTYFQNIYNILIRKGLIQEDPYKGDEKLSEVKIPPSSPIPETNMHENMGHRISAYHTQIEFLNTYYQISLDFLTINRLNKISELLKYIDWLQLTPTSTNPPTKFVADAIQKIKMGTDSISTQIVIDSCNQIQKNIKEIYNSLDEIIVVSKELYKFEIRQKVLLHIEDDLKLLSNNTDGALKAIKNIFPKYIPKKPFYTSLIKEILQEEYSENRDNLRQSILSKLKVKENKPKQVNKIIDHKPILLQGLRIIASTGFHIRDSIEKLTHNHTTYENRKISIGQKIILWIKKLIRGKKDPLSYEIEYFDTTTASTKTEKLNFQLFIEDLDKKAKFYSTISNKSSSTYSRIESASEEKLYDYLKNNISSLHVIYRRLSGLNDFFKSEMPIDKRSKIRTLNLELNAVKNSIVKANKKKHEYVSAKEEIEQMKRLGIKTSE